MPEAATNQTKALLTRVKESIDLPGPIVKEIQTTNPNALIIFPGDYKKILLFPRSVSQVLWVKLTLTSKALQQDFFLAISKTLATIDLNAIYTTGVCFQGVSCTWEGFFDYLPKLKTLDLPKMFGEISTVQKVEITVLEVT